MGTDIVTAIDLAREHGLAPREARRALRREQFPWHIPRHPWVALRGSPEHQAMARVVGDLAHQRSGRETTRP